MQPSDYNIADKKFNIQDGYPATITFLYDKQHDVISVFISLASNK